MFAIIQLNPTEQSNPSQPLNFGNLTNLSGPSNPSHLSSTPKPPNPSTPCNQCSTLGPAGVGMQHTACMDLQMMPTCMPISVRALRTPGQCQRLRIIRAWV